MENNIIDWDFVDQESAIWIQVLNEIQKENKKINDRKRDYTTELREDHPEPSRQDELITNIKIEDRNFQELNDFLVDGLEMVIVLQIVSKPSKPIKVLRVSYNQRAWSEHGFNLVHHNTPLVKSCKFARKEEDPEFEYNQKEYKIIGYYKVKMTEVRNDCATLLDPKYQYVFLDHVFIEPIIDLWDENPPKQWRLSPKSGVHQFLMKRNAAIPNFISKEKGGIPAPELVDTETIQVEETVQESSEDTTVKPVEILTTQKISTRRWIVELDPRFHRDDSCLVVRNHDGDVYKERLDVLIGNFVENRDHYTWIKDDLFQKKVASCFKRCETNLWHWSDVHTLLKNYIELFSPENEFKDLEEKMAEIQHRFDENTLRTQFEQTVLNNDWFNNPTVEQLDALYQEDMDIVFVGGIAGSGKTSVALIRPWTLTTPQGDVDPTFSITDCWGITLTSQLALYLGESIQQSPSSLRNVLSNMKVKSFSDLRLQLYTKHFPISLEDWKPNYQVSPTFSILGSESFISTFKLYFLETLFQFISETFAQIDHIQEAKTHDLKTFVESLGFDYAQYFTPIFSGAFKGHLDLLNQQVKLKQKKADLLRKTITYTLTGGIKTGTIRQFAYNFEKSKGIGDGTTYRQMNEINQTHPILIQYRDCQKKLRQVNKTLKTTNASFLTGLRPFNEPIQAIHKLARAIQKTLPKKYIPNIPVEIDLTKGVFTSFVLIQILHKTLIRRDVWAAIKTEGIEQKVFETQRDAVIEYSRIQIKKIKANSISSLSNTHIDLILYLYHHLDPKDSFRENALRHLFIDEVQDFSWCQLSLISFLTTKQVSLTVTGDVYQDLADVYEHSLNFTEVFGGQQVDIQLNRNLRQKREVRLWTSEYRRIVQKDTKFIEENGNATPTVKPECIQKSELHLRKMLRCNRGINLCIILPTDEATEEFGNVFKEFIVAETGREPKITTRNSTNSLHDNMHVQIASAYHTKGLEFDMVWVVDMHLYNLDTSWQRNLLYVALTRAKSRLFVSSELTLQHELLTTFFVETQGMYTTW